MVIGCDKSRLMAYLDGELSVAARREVESHLATCPACTAELKSLRELSSSFASYPFEDIRPDELSRLHAAIRHVAADEVDDQSIWRIGRTMGLIAASILVVAGTWLATLPAPSSPPPQGSPTTVAQSPPWERAATTLRIETPREAVDRAYVDSEWMNEQLKSSPLRRQS